MTGCARPHRVSTLSLSLSLSLSLPLSRDALRHMHMIAWMRNHACEIERRGPSARSQSLHTLRVAALVLAFSRPAPACWRTMLRVHARPWCPHMHAAGSAPASRPLAHIEVAGGSLHGGCPCCGSRLACGSPSPLSSGSLPRYGSLPRWAPRGRRRRLLRRRALTFWRTRQSPFR